MAQHTILVADEDQDTRIILQTLLELQGYRVIEARNAAEAMASAHTGISLVILNHPMCVTNGSSLACWLRAQPLTCEVPIINLTSRAVPLLIDEASRDGVNVTIAKPLDVQLIVDLVHEFTSPMATR